MSDELVPITVKLKPEMLAAIDAAQSVHGEGRAQFIRNAIAERIAGVGVPISEKARFAPERAGKGGQPTHRKAAASNPSQKPPSSSPVVDSIDSEEHGPKRGFPKSSIPRDRTGSGVVSEVGSDYQAPTARVPIQKREVPAEVLPDHTPSQREAILGSIPVAMRIARERKTTDDKRAAFAKVKAEKKAAEEKARKERAAAWQAKPAKK